MIRRTTIEIDEELLARAKAALGARTTRATVEEALRRTALSAEGAAAVRGEVQRRYLRELARYADPEVMASERMWR